MSASPIIARPMLRFLLTAAGLYLLWFFGYEQGLKLDGRLDEALSINIAAVSAGALRLFGFAASTDATNLHLLRMAGHPAVYVGNPCNGMVLYALFTGFVLAFPGAWRHKLWFVPVGILAIYLVNVVRVAALALNQQYWHHTVDFNHHYTFTFVVYGCIFLLWMLWVKRISPQPAPAGLAA